MKKSLEMIQPDTIDKSANLNNYKEAVTTMDWKNIEQHFTWSQTGKVNMVYEAIDRHVEEGKGDKKAFIYCDSHRNEEYTFSDLQTLSCKFANGLSHMALKKEIGSLFSCRGALNYT